MATTFRPSLLHLIPVLSSTASLTFCFTEYWTLTPFLNPSIPPTSLSEFWNNYLYQTIPGWLGFGLTSSITGFLSYHSLKGTTGITRNLYGWGVVFALGHYAFAPSVANIIERIMHGTSDKANDRLRTWLKVHTMRMVLVDIPAMACFLGGFVHLI